MSKERGDIKKGDEKRKEGWYTLPHYAYWCVWKDCAPAFKQTHILILHKTVQRDSCNERL